MAANNSAARTRLMQLKQGRVLNRKKKQSRCKGK